MHRYSACDLGIAALPLWSAKPENFPIANTIPASKDPISFILEVTGIPPCRDFDRETMNQSGIVLRILNFVRPLRQGPAHPRHQECQDEGSITQQDAVQRQARAAEEFGMAYQVRHGDPQD